MLPGESNTATYWQSKIPTLMKSRPSILISGFQCFSAVYVSYLATWFKSGLEIYNAFWKTFYFKLTCLSVALLTELSRVSPLPVICETPYFTLKLADFFKRAHVSLNSECLMCYTFEHKYYYPRHFLIHSLNEILQLYEI